MFRNRFVVISGDGQAALIQRFHADEEEKAKEYLYEECELNSPCKLIDRETGEVREAA